MSNDDELFKLTGLWDREDADGETYYTGRINMFSRVVLRPTPNASGDDPPWTLYVGPAKNTLTDAKIDRWKKDKGIPVPPKPTKRRAKPKPAGDVANHQAPLFDHDLNDSIDDVGQ